MMQAVKEPSQIVPHVSMRGLDLLGVVLSSACLIHCTVLPACLALLPLLGSHFHLDESMHFWLTMLIVPVACIALVTGYFSHRHIEVLAIGAVAISLILGVPCLHDTIGHLSGEILAALGGACLICAHLRNHKLLHNHAAHCQEACCG